MKAIGFFKSTLILLGIVLLGGLPILNAQNSISLPAHSSVYTSDVRGYWFTVPRDFIITGLRVPSEAGSGAQSIQVVKITGTPAVYSNFDTNFTTLYYINGAPNGVIQNVNIPVSNGDQIGVLGEAGVNTSYSSSASPFASSIFGMPISLGRLVYQDDINVTEANNYSTEASGAIGRIELYYSCAAPVADNIAADQISPCVFNFSLTNAQNASSYKWDFGDGTPMATGSTTAHAYATNGSYVVKAILYNECDSTTILKAVTCTTTGIDNTQLAENELKLYPNPAKKVVTIKSKNDLNLKEIVIYNLLGQKVYWANAQDKNIHVINVDQLPSGIYSVQIQTDKFVMIKKLELLK